MPRYRKYYFARVNFMGETPDDKLRAVETALTEKVEVPSRKYFWGVFDVGMIEFEGESFWEGHLVKFYPEFEEEIADTDTHTLAREDIENLTKAKVRFFLHAESSIVAYHGAGGNIRPEHFRKYFAKIAARALGDIFVEVHVDPIRDDEGFFVALRRFASITHVKIELHPTNPRFREEYRRYDERLKKLNARTYREEYLGAEGESLREIVDDEEIHDKMLMTTDGYGETSVTGEADGEHRTISSGQNPRAVSAPAEAEEAQTILRYIFDTLREIWGRMRG